MTLNCLIVDDEPLARQQIEAYINRVPYLKLIGTARNTIAAQVILATAPVDLIFLDIKMPRMSGIEFLRQSQVLQQVVFITAFPEYAIEGFELEVTDYLMKPVTFERFLQAVGKAFVKLKGSGDIKTIDHQPDFIYVKHNRRYEKLTLTDILFIESMLNYVKVVTRKEKYILYSSLSRLEQILPQGIFIRTHKSYLASLKDVIAMEDNQLLLPGFSVPVSRKNKMKVLKALNLR